MIGNCQYILYGGNVHISFFIKYLFDKAFFLYEACKDTFFFFVVVVEKYESSLATENKELYLTI